MKYKKYMILIMLTVFLFAMASVCAGDAGDKTYEAATKSVTLTVK